MLRDIFLQLKIVLIKNTITKYISVYINGWPGAFLITAKKIGKQERHLIFIII